MARKRSLGKIRNFRKTKELLVFLVFVGIASVFWLIMALNDHIQRSYEVKLTITNVPDSVTLITTPPPSLRVLVRDKGTNLVRYLLSGAPDLHLNFEEFSEGDRFRVQQGRLAASLRHIFGTSAVISSISPDSLSLLFTTEPGRKVPLELVYEATAIPGKVVLPNPVLSEKNVMLFSVANSDTLNRLFTQKMILRNLDKTTTVRVPVVTIPGTKAVPSTVDVTFTVESLVKKESEIPVTADNVPSGMDILFFPSKVRVAYFVPMSYFEDNSVPVRAVASFSEALATSSDKVGVKLEGSAPFMSNIELLTDSVEYTIVKGAPR